METNAIYSGKCRNLIFVLLGRPPYVDARGPLRGSLLFEELKRHSFVENELSEDEAIAIVSLIDRFGSAKAKTIVSDAKTSRVFTRGEYSESGGIPKVGKKKTKKITTKSKAATSKAVSEYTLVEGNNPNVLIQGVNKLIRSGWGPLGGVSVGARHQPKVEVLWSQAIFSPSSKRAINRSRSSIGLHSFQGIWVLPKCFNV